MEIGQEGLLRFKVPPDRTFIPLYAAMIVVYTIFMFIYFYNKDAFIFFMYTVPLSVGFYCILIFYIYYYNRPVAMSINNEGVVLDLPIKRHRTVKWEKITEIYASYGDLNTLYGRMNRVGGLSIYNRIRPVDLTYELAFVVRDEYFKRFGDQVNKVWRYSNKTRFR